LAERYGSAIEQFSVVSVQKAWCYIAKCYARTGQKDKALETIKTGLTTYARYTPKEDLVDIVKLYSSLSPKTKVETWGELSTLSQNTQAHDYALYNLAKVSPYEKAVPIYNQIIREYPHGDFASESMWEMMWDNYKHKRYKQALKISKIHRQKFRNTNAASKVLFWTGKILEKQGKEQQAINCYQEILENYNTSYYAFRAHGRIKGLRGRRDPMWSVDNSNRLNDSIFNINNPYPSYKMYAKYGREFLELVEIGDFEIASTYDITDDILDSWLNFKKGEASKSCLKARNIIDSQYPNPAINSDVCKLAFPLYYVEIINSESRRNRIDAALIISIIKEESHFNPTIRSSANAFGLMQILPSTASHIAARNGLNYSKSSDLLRPKTNIKLGSAYLRNLYEGSGNMMYSVASYNAGPGAVQKWVENYRSNDLDAFVEDIPYSETQNYVKKVFRSYWCYKRLY
jgi:soluble lytic murein transglycosylase